MTSLSTATNKEEEDFARLLIIKRDLIDVFDAIVDLNQNFQPLYETYDWVSSRDDVTTDSFTVAM